MPGASNQLFGNTASDSFGTLVSSARFHSKGGPQKHIPSLSLSLYFFSLFVFVFVVVFYVSLSLSLSEKYLPENGNG